MPGHKGILGNKTVDGGAKKVAKMGSLEEQELPKALRRKLPINSMAIKQVKMEKINKEERLCFEASPQYKRQHTIDPMMPSNRYMKILWTLNQKNQGATLTQLHTGHIPLAQHLKRINSAKLPNCAHCNQTKEMVFIILSNALL